MAHGFLQERVMEMMILIAIPAAAATVACVLILQHRAHQQGFREGVASAQVDAATRLVARGVAEQILAMEFAAAERGRPLTIALFSIDNFQRLAVMDGGAAGARLLLSAGAILRRRTRGMHVSARFDDGGLFISILGGSSPRGAHTFVERVRKDFRSLDIGPRPLVLSVAVCAYNPGMHSLDAFVANAHGTLAEARAKGGNQVVFSD